MKTIVDIKRNSTLKKALLYIGKYKFFIPIFF